MQTNWNKCLSVAVFFRRAGACPPPGQTNLRVFHNPVSVFIPPWKDRRIPESIKPISVVRDRPIPNGSGALGKYARASDDLHLQRGCGLPVKCMARDRPSHYDERGIFSIRRAGACPPRSLDCADDIKTREVYPTRIYETPSTNLKRVKNVWRTY